MISIPTIKVVFTALIVHLRLHQNVGKSFEDVLVLKLKSSCICPQYMLTAECTVNGTSLGTGTTIWKGDFFDCPEHMNIITLYHWEDSFTTTKQECNNGSILVQGVEVNYTYYISQLNILTLDNNMVGKTIECYYDFEEEILIGSLTLNITDIFSYQYITSNLKADFISGNLIFNWNSVAPDCPAIHYNILASNCGSCPTTTNHTNITCSDVPDDGSKCTVALQAAICGNITGNWSDTISVMDYLVDTKESLSLFIAGITIAIIMIILAGLFTCLVCWKMMKQSSGISKCNSNQICEDNDCSVRVFDNQKMGTYDLGDNLEISEIQICATMEEQPDLNSVLNILHNESTKTPNYWYLYGIAIGVPKVILEQLKMQDYSKEDCLVEMLDYWFLHHHSQPTWEEVIRAKNKVESSI